MARMVGTSSCPLSERVVDQQLLELVFLCTEDFLNLWGSKYYFVLNYFPCTEIFLNGNISMQLHSLRKGMQLRRV